jgi:DNA-binding GntR family transcriptional regulator
MSNLRTQTAHRIPADRTTSPRAVRLAEIVYQELREDIFAFRLLPGDRFAENDIAERLQVSRTPVREALMRLQSEGLVRGYFRNGWEIVPIDFSRFAALYELREMIELHAIGRLCEAPSGDAASVVVRQLGLVWRAAPKKRLRDGPAVAAIDEDFHVALVDAAGNPETSAVYRQVTERVRIMRRLDFAYADCIDETYDQHVAILDAVARGDRSGAAATLARHIQESHSVVRQLTIDRLEKVRSQRVGESLAEPERARRKRFS